MAIGKVVRGGNLKVNGEGLEVDGLRGLGLRLYLDFRV